MCVCELVSVCVCVCERVSVCARRIKTAPVSFFLC